MREKINENRENENLCLVCKKRPAVNLGVCEECQETITDKESEKTEKNANKTPLSARVKSSGRRLDKNIEEPNPSQENAIRNLEESEE